jgi:hypothetical protein
VRPTDGANFAPILSQQALNRALLARQHLLARAPGPMESVVEAMGGLQTQNAPSGYIGLWSRLEGMTRAGYTAGLEGRRLIQGWLMRITIHTVSAADYWPMAVAVRRPRRELWLRNWRLTDARMREAAGAVREMLAAGAHGDARLRPRGDQRRGTVGRPGPDPAAGHLGAAACRPLRARGTLAARAGA